MKLQVIPSRIRGAIAVPGSKSHTIRGVVAALAASGKSVLAAPLESADTLAVLAAAERLGAKCRRFPDRWEITGTGGRFVRPNSPVDLQNSGTGLRLLTAIAALPDFPVTFDGDASLRTRKMASLLAALQNLGAAVESSSGHCPLTVCGPLKGGTTTVDGSLSQYLSALLFALPLAPEDSVVTLEVLSERPYVGITTAWLDALGIRYRSSSDQLRWEIPGKQHYRAFKRTIPADFSTAAFPLAAAVLAGDGVTICNLDFADAQGDKAVFGFLEQMGAKLERGGELAVPGTSPLAGTTLDLNATPDALPILAVIGCAASGTTQLVNVAQARHKETDRISAMAEELGKMGADVSELADGLVIRNAPLHGAELASHGDHRIAMALAVAALTADSPSVIADIDAAAVTYPGFVADFQKLGANFTLLK